MTPGTSNGISLVETGGFGMATSKSQLMKADLHVHSKYSVRPSEWILRKLGCAESYTEPLLVYCLAKKRGMNLVTITDHNTISGSIEIAHLPDTFVSEEVTTYFPHDKCKLHVLVYDIREKHHEDISRIRESVFDLVSYLRQNRIAHALAHPLFAVNDKLTPDHVEKCLLLFRTFEINGTRLVDQNNLLREIVANITRQDIDRLSDKHDIQPGYPEPWKKRIIGGSDDHSSLNIARTYTEILTEPSKEHFLSALGDSQRAENISVRYQALGPRALSHHIYSVAYQFYKKKLGFDRYLGKDSLLRFLDHSLTPMSGVHEDFLGRLRSVLGRKKTKKSFSKGSSGSVLEQLRDVAESVLLTEPEFDGTSRNDRNGKRRREIWFQFIDQISERILKGFADSLIENIASANLLGVFPTIGSAAALYTVMAPYFVSYGLYAKERNDVSTYTDHFRSVSKPSMPFPDAPKVAHFTDTFHEVNGVALTLQKYAEAAVKSHKGQTIITCGSYENSPGVANFKPIGAYDLPEYSEIKLYYPPLLKMLKFCYENKFTHIHSATPGPVGLAALAIGKILGLHLYGTYHTAIPQYARDLTEDNSLEEIAWKYILWYYNQMEIIYAPSQAICEELQHKGIPKEKIRHYPRGVDTELFHPTKRNGFFSAHFNIAQDEFKLLYVGRVSREKNLPFLAEVFREICGRRKNLHLIVVGDGPYLDEMKGALTGFPVTFTGYLIGDDLSQAYASSDVFVFPSITDTFGNVVLEALASGLPAIVSDRGGPKESVIHGKSGFVLPPDNRSAFADTILGLVDEPDRLNRFKQQARASVENQSFETAYLKFWESYQMVS